MTDIALRSYFKNVLNTSQPFITSHGNYNGNISRMAHRLTHGNIDADGNLIEDKSKKLTITYNYQGLPAEFKRELDSGDSLRLVMSYSGSGARISKRYERKNADESNWGLQLATHYTSLGSEIRETGDGNTKVVVNLPGGFGRYGVEDAQVASTNTEPSFEWYLKNHLGSTMLVYGTSANQVKAAYDYRAFGERISLVQSTDKVTEEFTGKELDDETGLNYFGARYYDPMIGIWNTVDPARQFTSPYLYAGNGYNVVNGVDKDGKVLIFTSNASPEFKAEFTRAIDYLNKAGVSGVIARLEALPQEILVGAGITEASLTPTGQPQITWDPYGALQTTSGGTQSPALGLFHEAYHIESYLKNPEQHMLNLIPDGSSYDNPEERRVITGPETWAAKKLGEDTRTDHYGTDKTVSHSDER